jgi:glycerol-3-phosphate dehydrogenase
MQRNIESARDSWFDLLVIGGGIQGATVCYKAAERGLRVLLVDKGDFCGSSSANSLKILHGGLRYLQTLDFRRMRDSIRSRREIMRFAPHLVKPLACILPAYGHGLKGKEIMRLAMLLNDGISMDRNNGLPEDKRLPAGHLLSKEQCLAQVPGIAEPGLHGASVWYDALANNTERLVLEYILQATELGATCLNYLGVEALAQHSNSGIRAEAVDHLTGERFKIGASNVINTAGAAFEDLLPDSDVYRTPTRWARGLNIVVRKKLFSGAAVALEEHAEGGGSKRMLFMVPWRDHFTMIGTHYIERARNLDLFPVDKKDIIAVVDKINAIYPRAELSFDDVSFYHAGLLPMQDSSSTTAGDLPELSKESSIIDHAQQDAFTHYFSIKGIKYTTAPHVAEKVLKHMKPGSGYITNTTAGKSPGQTKTQTQMNDDYSGQKYGDRGLAIKAYIDADPDWLDVDQTLTVGEVNYFIAEEMVQNLSDVIFRRTDLGTAQCPSLDVLKRVNQILAKHFDWDEQRQTTELNQVLQRYAPLHVPSF